MNSRLLSMIGAVTLLPSSAWATQVCVDFDANYADTTSPVGDYWTTRAFRPMRGVRLRAWDITSNSHIWRWAAASGSDAGCADIPTAPGHSYVIYAYTRARVSYGNEIQVLDPTTVSNGNYDTEGTPYVAALGWLQHGQPESFVFDIAGVPNATLVLGVGSWALQRRNAGLGNTTFRAFTGPCLGDSTRPSCWSEAMGSLFIASPRRFVIAHEFGHAVAAWRNSGRSARTSYDAIPVDCGNYGTTPADGDDWSDSHEMTTREYQSAAANEGFAHYYAAVSFNNSGQPDCQFRYYKLVDYDNDGLPDSSTLNCEGGPPTSSGVTIGAKDYLGEQCTPASNRGTEYDWLRFWWDVDHDEGLSTSQIATIWDIANPYDWRATDSGPGAYPSDSIESAFTTLNLEGAWLNQGPSNGVHR